MFIKNLMSRGAGSTSGGNKLIKGLILAIFVGVFAYQATPALAYNPFLSISGSTITISGGQPNASVILNYTPSGSSLQTTVTGTTDYNGYFTAEVGNIAGQVTATVGGQQIYQNGNSGGCTYNCGSPYGLSLSQNNLSLNVGQSSTVTAYTSGSYYGGNLYISSNTNSSVATASLSANQINIYAQSAGSTNINVCTSSSMCATIYVTVNGGTGCSYSNCGGNITLSQTSLSLTAGQTSNVTIYNNTGSYSNNSYYVSSNSNSSVASASISGTTLYVYGGYTSGNTSIRVCQTNNSSNCVNLYVTVSGSSCGYNSNCGGTLSFSQSNVTLTLGQSSIVNVYNSNAGSFYVNSNSNSSVVSVSINGSSISLYGINNGSSTINICNNSTNQCGTIYVTVGSNGGSGNISLSQSNVTMTSGQSTTINIYGTAPFYINSNSNAGVVTATLSGSTLALYSLSSGNSTVSVCQQNYSSQCASVYVSVTGSGSGTGTVWFSQNTVNLNVGQTSTVTIYSNNYGGGYYLSSNPNPGMVNANVVGNQLNLTGQGTGYSTLSICQTQGSGSSACGSIYVSVNGGGSGGSGNGSVVSLSQNNLSLTAGQSSLINLYGSGGYYVSSNSNSSVASASLSGSQLNVYAGTSGTTTVNVCQNNYPTSCAALYVTVSGSGSGGGVLGANTYANGTLISEYGTVYITYKNMKTAFANAYAFTGLGFSFSNVFPVNPTNLSNSGYVVNSPNVQHPWGSWIKSGQAVYFVHQNGLIPVPNWNTFLNNGGSQDKLVNSNSWDFSLPMLSAMSYNDSRLQ